MTKGNADIIAQLQKDILALQGLRTISNSKADVGLGTINYAFPDRSFPLGAIHEFLCADTENATATSGFISAILAALMQENGVSLWINSSQNIFPAALKLFGIEPDKIIFVNIKKRTDILWVIEEALKYEGLAAVVGEIRELDFTTSRRFQLAVEQSRVTGFIIRQNIRNINITASVSRWKITSLPSLSDALPGVGFPCWNVELLKIRNGKPGNWQLECIANRFRHISSPILLSQEQRKKTG